jgi:hypothetical protein
MGFAELRSDAKQLRERLAKLALNKLDAKHELVENVLPLVEAVMEAVEERLAAVEEEVADLGEAIDVLIDQDGDVLHAETAAKFAAVLEVGKLMAVELEAAIGKLDDGAQKRAKKLIVAYRQGVAAVTEIITEITLPMDEEEEEEGDEDADVTGNVHGGPSDEDLDDDEAAAEGGG